MVLFSHQWAQWLEKWGWQQLVGTVSYARQGTSRVWTKREGNAASLLVMWNSACSLSEGVKQKVTNKASVPRTVQCLNLRSILQMSMDDVKLVILLTRSVILVDLSRTNLKIKKNLLKVNILADVNWKDSRYQIMTWGFLCYSCLSFALFCYLRVTKKRQEQRPNLVYSHTLSQFVWPMVLWPQFYRLPSYVHSSFWYCRVCRDRRCASAN